MAESNSQSPSSDRWEASHEEKAPATENVSQTFDIFVGDLAVNRIDGGTVAICILGLWAALTASSVTAQSPPRKDIPTIAKAANGAVVSIIVGDKDRPIALGTGFFINKNGAIITTTSSRTEIVPLPSSPTDALSISTECSHPTKPVMLRSLRRTGITSKRSPSEIRIDSKWGMK